MQLSELQQIVNLMGLMNRLADRREYPRERCSEVVELLAAFIGQGGHVGHAHENAGDGSDTCKQCGCDLRHPVHRRVETEPAVA